MRTAGARVRVAVEAVALWAALGCGAAVPAGAAAATAPEAAPPGPPAAAQRTPLDAYLQGLKSLRVSFSQSVKDAQGHQTDQATGELLVLRPGRFRWESHEVAAAAAAGQLPGASGAAGATVGTGTAGTGTAGAGTAGTGTAGAGTTGAASGAAAGAHADAAATDGGGQLLVADGRNVWFYDPDLQQVTVRPMDAALSATPVMLLSGGADVRKAFDISAAGTRENLQWVRVVPRGANSDFRQALLGFGGGELRQMLLEDKLGQTATFAFSRSQRNAPVAESEVSFTVPPGADVLGTPQK